MRFLKAIIILSVFVFLSCNSKNEKKSKVENKKVEQVKLIENKFEKYPKDVFYTSGDCILFLRPSEDFFENELKDLEGIYEVDGDFGFYIDRFLKQYDKEYKIYNLDQRIVALINPERDTTFIDRYEEDLIYGVIIRQNDSIRIMKGIQTDLDIKMALGIFNPNELQ